VTSTSPREPSARDLAELTLRLCEIPSVIGDERAIADWVAARLAPVVARRDTTLVRVSHSLALMPRRRPHAPLVLLVGHLDTVSARQSEPPHIAGKGRDARVYGCGATDMKGGLALMIAIAEQPPIASDLDVGFVLYEREEGPYAESGLGPLMAAVPEIARAQLGICLEPTANVVQVGCVGTMHARLVVRGRRAHSARPWEGDNAVTRAIPLLADLAARGPRPVDLDGLRFHDVMTVTQAVADGPKNVVPETFALNVNVRFAPGRSADDARAELDALVAGRAEIIETDRAPSGRVCLDNALATRLIARSGAPIEAKQAWTDVARLSASGVDALNFGPGHPALAHQADEWIAVDALATGYGALRRFFARDVEPVRIDG